MIEILNFDFYNRLKTDYITHKSLFVAFDYHNIGIDFSAIITLILFTANEGKALGKVKIDLKNRNIPYDLINENPLMNTRKPYYNILLDYRAGLKEAYTNLKKNW